VRAVEEWPDVEAAEGASLAVAPDRRVEWIPVVRPEFSAATGLSYADLLADTMAHREELVDGGRLRLDEPAVERIPRHTVWVNWPAIHMAITGSGLSEAGAEVEPYRGHLRHFLESELTTTSSENAEGQLILRGRWRTDDLRGLLRRYVTAYKRCLQCRGYATGLVRVDGVLKVRCARCRCENVTGHVSA
jgi:translation initiation factor 2 beta subunit (eIF-2beta)/eIF-5